MSAPDKREYFVASQLKEFGWTDSLIKKFMPEPDETRKNPHYRSGPPMKLYLQERVRKIESTPEFRQAKEKAAKRKTSARKAVETKLERLLAHLASIEMEVPKLTREEVISRACRHFNNRKSDIYFERNFDERFSYTPASAESDPIFLERISVNYLRHRLSNYERRLARVYGRVGVKQAYKEISRKVYAAIGDAYPWLEDECERQLERKLDQQE